MEQSNIKINIISSIILQIVTIICGFFIPRLIISTYGSSVNGLTASIAEFLGFITVLEGGVGVVVRSTLYKPIANKDKETIENILKSANKFFRKIAFIFVAYVLVLCVIYPFNCINQFNFFYTASLILIMAIGLFAEYFFGITYSIYLHVEQKRYISSTLLIITKILNACIIWGLVCLKQDIHIVQLVSTLVFLIRPIIQCIYVRKKYNISLKEAANNYKIKQKWDGFIQHITYIIYSNTDIVLISIFLNLKEVSVYSVYAMITNRLRSLMNSISDGIDASFGNLIARDEKEKLNKNFSIYEGLYFTIATIIFSTTLVLIIPFVKLYTRGITDVDYIRPVFASVIVLSRFIYIIRQPYYNLVKVAGHFRQTKPGAIIEAFLNIIVSVVLIIKMGIVGVIIGTCVAAAYRTIEIMFYTAKNFLQRPVLKSFKVIFIITVEIAIIMLISKHFIPKFEIENYKVWIIYAIATTIAISVFIMIINALSFKEMREYIFAKKKVSDLR